MSIDARTHVATTYDQGAPNRDVNPVDNQPYRLPTTVTTTAYNVATQTDTGWPDESITVTGYAAVNSGDTWVCRGRRRLCRQPTTLPATSRARPIPTGW